MFELSNYLVGIFKVDDCTDSVTLVNHPPDPLPPSTQSHVTTSQQIDLTLDTAQNGEEKESEQTEQSDQLPPLQSEQLSVMHSDLSRACGRDTTFAPPLESTVITQPVQQELSEVVASPSELSIQSPLATINA